MDLKIREAVDSADHANEHVVIDVLSDTNLTNYLILDTTSSRWRHGFTFPDHEVEKGDVVRLFTKEGSVSVSQTQDKKNFQYTFYWGLNDSVWNKGDNVYLIEMADIASREIR